MTVGELIEKLKQYDPEMPVIKELYIWDTARHVLVTI